MRKMILFSCCLLVAFCFTGCDVQKKENKANVSLPDKTTETSSITPTAAVENPTGAEGETNPEPKGNKVAPEDSGTADYKLYKDIPRIPRTDKPYFYFINTVDDEDILPDPTTYPIYSECLEALSASQLRLLRNEIYARHGYVFKSKELNDYFSQKSWYYPEPNLKEVELSGLEKENLDWIQYYEKRKPFVLIGGNIISWDLDGDGKQELIQFDAPGYDEYTLHVNHKSITARGDNLLGYCSVIDLDTSDSQCEIMVRSIGPSNDDSFQLFRWKDGNIELIGEADGLLDQVQGNGYCSVWIRASILQTWFLQDMYKLNDEGILTDVGQDYFPLAAEIKLRDGDAYYREIPPDFTQIRKEGSYMYQYNILTMLRDLPVVAAPGDCQPAGVLKKGELVAFLGSDNRQWVKIQGESGIVGWFEVRNFSEIVIDGKGYYASEFFDSLSYAD